MWIADTAEDLLVVGDSCSEVVVGAVSCVAIAGAAWRRCPTGSWQTRNPGPRGIGRQLGDGRAAREARREHAGIRPLGTRLLIVERRVSALEEGASGWQAQRCTRLELIFTNRLPTTDQFVGQPIDMAREELAAANGAKLCRALLTLDHAEFTTDTYCVGGAESHSASELWPKNTDTAGFSRLSSMKELRVELTQT